MHQQGRFIERRSSAGGKFVDICCGFPTNIRAEGSHMPCIECWRLANILGLDRKAGERRIYLGLRQLSANVGETLKRETDVSFALSRAAALLNHWDSLPLSTSSKPKYAQTTRMEGSLSARSVARPGFRLYTLEYVHRECKRYHRARPHILAR